MRQASRLHLFALTFVLSLIVKAAAQDATFTTIDFPGATLTEAWGINPPGDIVGLYAFADRKTHGFPFSRNGEFISIEVLPESPWVTRNRDDS